jgi:hypothetical protein
MDLTEYRASTSEQSRIADLLNLVPSTALSALDIGARDGYISSLLADRAIQVTALDLEKPVIADMRIRCVQGDITALDFADSHFDLLLCAEVLEHIPPQLLAQGCAEIQRVARRDVLIGVPYRQDTRFGQTTCQACGAVNPPWGHVNRFDERKLKSLFPNCTVQSTSFVGTSEMGTNSVSAALMTLAGNPYGTYSQEEPCVQCGKDLGQPSPRTFAQKIATRASTVVRKIQRPFHRPHANWIHMLLRKRDNV